MLGEATALRLLQPMLWHYARLSRPAQAGSDELFYAAIGYEMLQGEYAVRSLPESDLVDCVGQWREHGRSVLTTVLGRPAVKAPAPGPIRRLQEARRRAPVDGPSLRVLASVEHLPGSAKDGDGRPGGSTASTARGEYAPMAGRDMPLVVVPDLARVRRRLVREFPDAAGIIDAILAPLAGRRFAWLSPILLRGAPGSGKSRLARRLGEELGLAVTVYSCGAVSDGSFIGTSRMYATGRACVPLQAVKRADKASVLIVLDEISRAGTRADNGRLVDGVLALTERETARAFHDPYVECAVDLSAVSYIATANDTTNLDPALLSRFRVYDMALPTVASLPVLAQGIAEEVRRDRGLDAVWLPDLTPEELEMVAEHWPGGSVRVLQALVECALDGRQTGPANRGGGSCIPTTPSKLCRLASEWRGRPAAAAGCSRARPASASAGSSSAGTRGIPTPAPCSGRPWRRRRPRCASPPSTRWRSAVQASELRALADRIRASWRPGRVCRYVPRQACGYLRDAARIQDMASRFARDRR